ncbi:MAG: DUF4212 domain-containing protein [Intrasporangiaceae bacterium]|nr:DUF4212 domain-containing protein [Intrasporangiaceae bacterium]
MDAQQRQAYWRENLKVMAILLVIWALVSYGAGILFVDQLNSVNMPLFNVPLGFWFAQQGSIVVFVILIFVYVKYMDRLDKKYGVEEYEQEVHHS